MTNLSLIVSRWERFNSLAFLCLLLKPPSFELLSFGMSLLEAKAALLGSNLSQADLGLKQNFPWQVRPRLPVTMFTCWRGERGAHSWPLPVTTPKRSFTRQGRTLCTVGADAWSGFPSSAHCYSRLQIPSLSSLAGQSWKSRERVALKTNE